VYEDWVLSRALDRRRDGLSAALVALGQLFGLLRPLQFVALSMLERTADAAAWLRLLKAFPWTVRSCAPAALPRG
jgi:hypothetical protein